MPKGTPAGSAESGTTPTVVPRTLFSEEDLSGSAETPEEHTWSVAELHDQLSGLIIGHFGSRTWVTGELRSLNRSQAGHRYFELIEPGSEGDYNAPRLKVTLFARNRKRVNAQITEAGNAVQIEEGTVLRICGDLRVYAARSTVQLVMTGIDPAYTLGVVTKRREAVLAALAAENLLDVNSSVVVPYPPMRVGVVTSMGSAAAADTLHELNRAGIGFDVVTIDARTQGAEAETTLVAALRTAEELALDVILLIRGGGSASDLSVFDSENLARAIAGLDVAVFTGIGHETDHSVADEVAHSAFKTPTAAASGVVTLATEARRSLEQASASLRSAIGGTLIRAEQDLGSAARSTVVACRSHLEREDALLAVRLERITAAAPLGLGRIDQRVEGLATRIADSVEPRIDRATRQLEGLAALVKARDPEAMMALGWSIVHDSRGNLVRSTADVSPGDATFTTLADGTLSSTVAGVAPDDAGPSTPQAPRKADDR